MAGTQLTRRRRLEALTGAERRGILLATFFSFMPAGAFIAMMQTPAWGWSAALYSGLIAGVSSVMWASAFMYQRYWVIPIIALWQMLGPMWLARWLMPTGVLTLGGDFPERVRLAINACMGLVFMVAGYVLSIIATRRVESRAAEARAELQVARQMHDTLVPAIDTRLPGLRVYGRSAPSTEMGGDLADVVVRGTRADVFLADVAGHGVRAGVLMAMLKSSLRTLLLEDLPPDRVARDANRAILQVNEPGMFITFASMRFERQGEAAFVLAGHLPILRYEATTGRLVELANDELPLGIDDSPEFACRTTPALPGDLFVIFTDGLMEVMDSGGKQMGMERIRELVRAHGAEADELVFERIMGAVRQHGPQSDDQTMLLVRVAEPR
jgi:hypothetical protein